MKSTIKHPIKRRFIVGCTLFVTCLCIAIGILSYSGFKQTLYSHNEDYIRNLLRYTASHIDNDDLKECIETGRESDKYRELQAFLDDVKENFNVDYVYVIVPLNTDETDNVMNVIEGVRKSEYEDPNYELMTLDQLSGDSYTPETAKKYLDAYEANTLTYFEENSTWGDEYTGMYPLRDSHDKQYAALCVDVNIHDIRGQIVKRTAFVIGATILIGAFFLSLFVYLVRRNITKPIQDLERAVTAYAAISHKHESPDSLVLVVPSIHTGNEVESLSNAVVKMSDDIRDYAKTLAAAEEEVKERNIALNEALNDAQAANRAKTAFLSNMSHEIRTPMNAIIGLDHIAMNDPEISDSTREYLDKIGASAQHLLRIINDILDMSRIESGRMTIKNEEFSFAKSVEQVNTIISEQCRDKGLSYDCRILGGVEDYYIGDDMKLRQIMINILGNSVKFTPVGGSITFIVERVAHFDKNATLRFTFEDNGIGMSKEFLPKIFDSFSQEDTNNTSKYGTTGLGMSITKSLVELMHGDIRVESEKGKGTKFTVTVTLKESDRNAKEAGELEINPGEMTVLIVDDDEVAGEHAKLLLGQSGVVCETAPSGEEALRMIELRHARRELYDLILIDWRMPDMDGIETTRKIRSVIGSESVIVMLTAYYWDEIADEAKDAGVDCFVSKPLFTATVLNEYSMARRNRSGDEKENKAELSGRRILVAEDVPINAEIMLMILSERGMEADVAENGEQAVDLFSAHPEGYYDAILMDMRMPIMDGLEASGAIRAMNRSDSSDIPIIALTANAFDEDVQRSLQAGLNAHLSKPVEPEILYETLESLIKP